MTLRPGDTLPGGRYRIEGEIGAGAFGVVYKAQDTQLDRPVAIKELRRDAPGMGSTRFEQFEERFRREARVQAQFNHPHIVHAYELIEQEGALYLVLEYVDGGTLKDYVQQHGPLPVAEAVRITLEVLAALKAVHAHPLDIVHRDIKPSNILITRAGHAKLTDFGLAQLAGESSRSVGGKAHPGTPLYMSPEQTRSHDYLRPASDLFSVGCVLFELLTGQVYKQVDQEALRLVPRKLRAVLARALKVERVQRYTTAADFTSALQSAGRSKRLPRWGWLLLGLLGLVGAGVVWGARSAPPPVTPTQDTVATIPAPTATPTSPPTATSTPLPTATPTATATPSSTPAPSSTHTPSPIPTATFMATMTPEPTATPTSIPIQIPDNHIRPSLDSTRILLVDQFVDENLCVKSEDLWDTYYSGGEYFIHAKAADKRYGCYYSQELRNFAAEIQMRSTNPGFWEGGIRFRSQSCWNEYEFEIDSLQRYFLRTWKDGKQIFLVSPTYSPHILIGL